MIHRPKEGEKHWFTLRRKKNRRRNEIAKASRKKNRKRG
jgi:hypothetical protein